MTCIVGVIEREKIWIGADALAVGGFDAYDLASPKVFRNGPYLIGVAGSPRVSQLLQYELSLANDDRVKDARRFMVSNFVPAFRKILADGGARGKNNEVEEVSGYSWAMVAFRGRLFSIASDFQVVERTEPYDSIGCGRDLALGSLFETATSKMPPKKRIERALKCAERFSAGVRGPFTILSAEGK